MPGDYSRKTFDRKKHYSGVLMQQGRVQLDADWNEQVDIEQYRTFTETKDVIGSAGVPLHGGGFQISASSNGTDLAIAPGRIYIEGLLCELEAGQTATYKNQPYYPSPDLSPFFPVSSPAGSPPQGAGLKDGSYIAYLKAWQREINYLDDPAIQEKALGEADTATRLQTAWQVRLLPVQDGGAANCDTPFPEWSRLTAPLTGTLTAQTATPGNPKDPCVLPPSAGYLRLENQLYRVQVQTVDAANHAKTFVWSRDNASVETTVAVNSISGNTLTVADIGKDEVLGFAGNQWVELVDEASALNGHPYPLVQIAGIDPGTRQITMKTSLASFAGKTGLKLRRWDMDDPSATQDGLAVTAGWIDVEDGIRVKFDNGTFEPGDYWLIPARTATGNIEWPLTASGLDHLPQPRVGTQYYYCRLALVKVAGSSITIEDCRKLFSPLTEIDASNGLKDHNKHLHGHGVVCGLKVKCGPTRQQVTVETGYALDCEGNVIRNKTALNFNVIAEIAKSGLLKGEDGPVCLSIAYNGASTPILHVEPFIRQSFWEEILEGTLLKDFLDGCIRSLLNALKADIQLPVKQAVPVPLEQRRLTALINLLFQLVNTKSGQYAFISGNREKKHSAATCTNSLADRDEDNLLYCFYERLKVLLQSETYCAQNDRRSYPDYTIDSGLSTIFGTPLKKHTRLKIDAAGNFAYTCNGNGQIYVYDLKKAEFVRWLDFPAPNAQVQDLCFSADRQRLYVAAVTANKDSLFATVLLSSYTWQGPFAVAGLQFVTLALHTPSQQLFAIARSVGLYVVLLSATGVAVRKLKDFNATGLMTPADDLSFVYAAASDAAPGTEDAGFTSIRIFDVSTGAETRFSLSGDDADNDLLYHNRSVYATGNAPAGGVPGRVLVRYWEQFPLQTVLLENTGAALRLAAVRRNSDISDVLISFSDGSKVLRVSVTGQSLAKDDKFRIPVQLFPMDIAISNAQEGSTVYVLNTVVNTLTAINVNKVLRGPQLAYTLEPPEAIADYRDAAIEAFKSLFVELLQYLKDCFCDKFLVDCPTCGEKEKVYLGTLDIRNSQVHHICNFSKRKYVKTFPTVEYWLSAIPVLPVFKKAFTVFCCTVLDDVIKKN